MEPKYFASIPLYRFSKEEFDEKIKVLISKSLPLEDSSLTIFEKYYSYSWQFNEIVGWLRLYFYHSLLQVDCCLYEHSRVDWQIRLKKKKYINIGRKTEFFVEDIDDSIKATDNLIRKIDKWKNNYRALKKMYIDFSEFRQIGNALDWKKIKMSSNPYAQ